MTNYDMPFTQFCCTTFRNGVERVYYFKNNAQGWKEMEKFKEETGIDLLQNTLAKYPEIRIACHFLMEENPQKTWDLNELINALPQDVKDGVFNKVLKECGLLPLP